MRIYWLRQTRSINIFTAVKLATIKAVNRLKTHCRLLKNLISFYSKNYIYFFNKSFKTNVKM
jgi:hypothetical protein